jgi:hypothetical protein
VAKGKLKSVDVEFQAKVEYWASTNHLQRLQDIWDNDQNVYAKVFE